MTTEKKEEPVILNRTSTKVRQAGGCNVLTVPKKWMGLYRFLRCAKLEMRSEYMDGKYYLIVEIAENEV